MSTPGAESAYLVPVDLFEQIAAYITEQPIGIGRGLLEFMGAIRERGTHEPPARHVVVARASHLPDVPWSYLVVDLDNGAANAVLSEHPGNRGVADRIVRALNAYPTPAPPEPFDENEEPF